ncbi:glycosyltransferase [Treponema sp. UBA6852]|uniref:glycosyltransferase n=1 Tax=Treponema sp. UBA6852 TaxID=1947744 RepID=UPI000E84FF05|nr:glycosyltransferase [Treponema sp. UBA6852]HBP09598.1 glycosyltransferase family 4 protein [Treponema sp.]
MKVAIVHDWLVNYGGAETWVEYMLRLYPDADIYTLVYNKKKMGSHFANNKIYTSYIQKLPFASRIYTKLLKFMPNAFEAFDFSGYDLVLCSSSCCAKGVITPPSVPHIAYIHSPMRYAWDLFFDYRKRSGKLTRFFMNRWIPALRQWDFISSQRIDAVVANSNYIARRIKKFWNLDAKVVYCPINTERFFPADVEPEDFYVAFSRLVPYKRIDLAVSACKKLGRKLVVVGAGSEMENLKKLAGNDKNILFAGRAEDSEVRSYLQRCRALIFCAEEDLGLTPLEAQTCGRPVIAFGKGGALETVVDGKTGIFFDKQETDSVASSILEFEQLDSKGTFKKEKIISHARQFSIEKSLEQFQKIIKETQEKLK